MTKRLVAALAVLLSCLPCAGAARPRRRHTVPSVTVNPSPAIEARVSEEISRGRQILSDLRIDNVLSSSYLISALYYHDGFLSRFPDERPDANPPRRIIAPLVRWLAPELKARYIALLRAIWLEGRPEAEAGGLALPVEYTAPRTRRWRRHHQYAIDLFAPEGSPVRSASQGLVVLAESGWTMSDLLSTTSPEGGNTIIVFDPEAGRFFRYCHLSAVLVDAGVLVEAGDEIGRVGHSGLNASRPGHGRHLHFEVNQYEDGNVRALPYRELRALLRHARTAAGAREEASAEPVRHRRRRATRRP